MITTTPLTNYLNSISPFLIEIRRRLFYILIVVSCVLLSLLPFNTQLFTLIVHPLQQWLPKSSHLVATKITATFIIPLKITVYLSVLLSIPFIFYQIWSFASPALYTNEKNKTWPLLFFSLLLFYLGLLFAFYFILPIIFHFFVTTTPPGVLLMTDISAYLDFIVTLLFAFGVAFQCPLIILLLVKFNLVKLSTLKKQRPYFVIFAFTIGMLLTPPDVISQTLLAIPLCLLFECGLLLIKLINHSK